MKKRLIWARYYTPTECPCDLLVVVSRRGFNVTALCRQTGSEGRAAVGIWPQFPRSAADWRRAEMHEARLPVECSTWQQFVLTLLPQAPYVGPARLGDELAEHVVQVLQSFAIMSELHASWDDVAFAHPREYMAAFAMAREVAFDVQWEPLAEVFDATPALLKQLTNLLAPSESESTP